VSAATATTAPAPTPQRSRNRIGALVGRVPRAARVCFLIAFVNATLWALLIPPYQVPDEIVHVAYTQYFAETGKLPSHDAGSAYSSEETSELGALSFFNVIGNRADKPPWSTVEQTAVDHASRGQRRDDGGHYSVASNNPPLFYMVEAVAYHAAPGASLLTRLYLMRIACALMAAATVLLTFMFLRELMPGWPLAWTVGALAVAFQPMFGFESGGVNPDNLLYACSAALFFALARAFRRGLTVRRGVAIGAALGAGIVTKGTMVAFVPAVGVALLWLLWRAAPERRAALRGAATSVAVGAAPVALYVFLNAVVWGRPLLADAAGVSVPSGGAPGVRPVILREELSYIWQLFLPRVPSMTDTFRGQLPLWDTWFTGFNGRFGWLDYAFPPSFYKWIWWTVYFPLLALAGAGLWRLRRALRSRLVEFGVYALVVLGLVVVIGRPSYTSWLAGGFPFYQPRYILPLLPLYAAIIALSLRGAGRRWAPALGALVVMLALTHTLAAELLTLTRYYG
jgi:4-amino-4-deoxy-L-arabinose transferase-like glycosyltransferase